MVGKDFWETPWFTGTPGMPEKVREGVARVAAGESIQIAMPLSCRPGDRIYEFSMRPALDETGKVVALVPEAVEITARVRAEQALAAGAEDRSHRQSYRRHRARLQQSADGGPRQPRTVAQAAADDAGLLRLVDNAAEGARRGKSLTARMLAFARRQDLKPERVDVAQLVGGMAELMAALARADDHRRHPDAGRAPAGRDRSEPA